MCWPRAGSPGTGGPGILQAMAHEANGDVPDHKTHRGRNVGDLASTRSSRFALFSALILRYATLLPQEQNRIVPPASSYSSSRSFVASLLHNLCDTDRYHTHSQDLAYCNQLPVGVISWGIISYSEPPFRLENALRGHRHTSFVYTTLHRLTTATTNFTWALRYAERRW